MQLRHMMGAIRVKPCHPLLTTSRNICAAASKEKNRRDQTVRQNHLLEALKLVRATAVRRYDQGVAVAVNLNVDAKRSDERVRGSAILPHGTGTSVRVAVFARGALAEAAVAAGADRVGAEDLIELVKEGNVDFARCLATPDVMPMLAKVARVLGQKGLMPNARRGSVLATPADLSEAVSRAKGGEVQFRAQKEGLVHAPIGKISFTDTQLQENADAFL